MPRLPTLYPMDAELITEVSKAFWSTFAVGGGIVADCGCGVTHFGSETGTYYHWEPGEFARLLKLSQEKPKQYMHHEGCDCVDYIEVLGRRWVGGCPCNYGPSIEILLWDHSDSICKYVAKRANAELRRALGADAVARIADGLMQEHNAMQDTAKEAAMRLKDG